MSEQFKQIVWTVLRVFAGTVLAQLVLDLANLMDFHWDDWKPVVVSAVSAAIVVIINALNPADSRYGVNAGT